MKKLLAVMFLFAPSAIAQGATDDLPLAAPKTETRTVAGWRPVAWAVELERDMVMIRVQAYRADSQLVPGTDTTVVITKDGSTVQGYAVTGLNIPPRCSEKYSVASAMAIRQSFALAKKCLDK